MSGRRPPIDGDGPRPGAVARLIARIRSRRCADGGPTAVVRQAHEAIQRVMELGERFDLVERRMRAARAPAPGIGRRRTPDVFVALHAALARRRAAAGAAGPPSLTGAQRLLDEATETLARCTASEQEALQHARDWEARAMDAVACEADDLALEALARQHEALASSRAMGTERRIAAAYVELLTLLVQTLEARRRGT